MLRQVKQFIRLDAFAANAGKLVVASVIGQGVVMLAMPLITRLYSTQDFGVYSVYGSLLGFFSAFACLRYERAIPLPSDDKLAANVCVVALIVGIFFSAVLFLLIPLVGHFFVDWLKFPRFYPYLWLLPLGVCGAAIYAVTSYWAIRQRRFKSLAKTKIAQGVGQVAAQLVFAFLPFAALGLLVGQIIGHVAGAGGLSRDAYKYDQSIFSHVQIVRLFGALKRYLGFVCFSAPGAVLNSVAFYIPALLLTVQHGITVAGFYGLASQAVRMPLALIEASVGKVYLGEAAKLAHVDLRAMLRLYLSTMFRLLIIGIMPVLVLLLFGPKLFSLVFGVHWYEAGVYAQVLAPMFLVEFLVVAPSQNLSLLEKQHIYFFWNIVFCVLVLLAFLPSHFLSVSPRATLMLLALSIIIAYFCLILLNIYAIMTHARYKNETNC